MISPQSFIDSLYNVGFQTITGVPCSFFAPVINATLNDSRFNYLMANNEGEALAMASGSVMVGRKACVMIQNSGLGNMINPLTSLNYPFRIPVLLVVTWRGEPGIQDEPQHELMGQVTEKMLNTVGIPTALIPDDASQFKACIQSAEKKMNETGQPFALILKKGVMEACDLKDTPKLSYKAGTVFDQEMGEPDLNRTQALSLTTKGVPQNSIFIGTTGKTGRELFALEDRANNLYMVGSMGCASSFGLGLALFLESQQKVIVLDGDGAALMRLEAMASVGHYRPPNYLHIILDNEIHDSTGGQQTLSPTVRFDQIAAACGYQTAVEVASSKRYQSELKRVLENPGPHLIRLKIKPGSPVNLPRPNIKPHKVKERLIQFIAKNR